MTEANLAFRRLRDDRAITQGVFDIFRTQEKVLPVKDFSELERRVRSPFRDVFAAYHPERPSDLQATLHVAYFPESCGSMHTILERKDVATRVISDANAAICYSISSYSPGAGRSLIMWALQKVAHEEPKLEVFTLSPMPGFLKWLSQQPLEQFRPKSADGCDLVHPYDLKYIVAELKSKVLQEGRVPSVDNLLSLGATSRALLMVACSNYMTLGYFNSEGKFDCVEPVSKFHLKNGSRAEHLYYGGDFSEKGRKESAGIKVSFRYSGVDLAANTNAYNAGNPARTEEIARMAEGVICPASISLAAPGLAVHKFG